MSQNEKATTYAQIFEVCCSRCIAYAGLARLHFFERDPLKVFRDLRSRNDMPPSEWGLLSYRSANLYNDNNDNDNDNPNAYALTEAYITKMVPNDLWMMREIARSEERWEETADAVWTHEIYNMLNGYRLLGAPYFVRLSKEQPDLWVYTASPEHGRQDRQTRLKLGKLLGKLATGMPPEKIKKYATWFGSGQGGLELRILRTEEEIIEAYANGPDSCMSGDASVAAYASEDLGLAVVPNFEGTRVSSRCVVNMKDKQYSRIYGSVERLEPLLQAAGYARGSLEGCRLKTIFTGEHKQVIKLPWLDHPHAGLVPPDNASSSGSGPFWWVRDKFLVGSTNFDYDKESEVVTICHAGEYQGGSQAGNWVIGGQRNGCHGATVDDLWTQTERNEDCDDDDPYDEDGYFCPDCEEHCDRGYTTYIEGIGESVCESCAEADRYVEGIVDCYGTTGYMVRDDALLISIRYAGRFIEEQEFILEGVELRDYSWVEREDCYGANDDLCQTMEGDTEFADECYFSEYHSEYVYKDEVVRIFGEDSGEDLIVWEQCDELRELTQPSMSAGKWALDADSVTGKVADEYLAVEVQKGVWILATEVEAYESGTLFKNHPTRFGNSLELGLTMTNIAAYSEAEIEDEDTADTTVSGATVQTTQTAHA